MASPPVGWRWSGENRRGKRERLGPDWRRAEGRKGRGSEVRVFEKRFAKTGGRGRRPAGEGSGEQTGGWRRAGEGHVEWGGEGRRGGGGREAGGREGGVRGGGGLGGEGSGGLATASGNFRGGGRESN